MRISDLSSDVCSSDLNAEIGAELHRAAHAFGYIDEGAVGKDRAIERCEIIVVHRHDLAEPLLHQLGIFADRFRNRQEDHPRALQFLAEGRRDADAVEHRVDRALARALDPGEPLLPLEPRKSVVWGKSGYGRVGL